MLIRHYVLQKKVSLKAWKILLGVCISNVNSGIVVYWILSWPHKHDWRRMFWTPNWGRYKQDNWNGSHRQITLLTWGMGKLPTRWVLQLHTISQIQLWNKFEGVFEVVQLPSGRVTCFFMTSNITWIHQNTLEISSRRFNGIILVSKEDKVIMADNKDVGTVVWNTRQIIHID